MRIAFTLAAAALAFGATPALASWSTQAFTAGEIDRTPSCSGVYIIMRSGDPYYVGRSRVDIRERLRRHRAGSGSRRVADLVRNTPDSNLSFTYECLTSVEQMEAQLIATLGTTRFGNLRGETDPADWE
jgi:hypothetical protein